MLLISRCPPYPLYFGDRLIPYHLARQLASRHYHIDLIAFYDSADDIANIPRYDKYFRNIQLIPEPKRGRSAYISRLRRRGGVFPKSAQQAWSPAMWGAIEARLASNRYDVIHLFGGIQVYEYRNLVMQFPNVIVPYESFSLFLSRSLGRERNPIRRLTLRAQLATAERYEQMMFAGYDRLVVVAEPDKQMLRSLNSLLPVYVIPNGVDTDFFNSTGQEPDRPTLLFNGNFEYAPNVDAALVMARQILPIVRQQVPDARLLLVGNNPPRSLTSLALKDDNIEVTGRVPDMRPYLDKAMIFVSPLRYGAGIKNKVLEAMAMRKPIVATPLSCDGINLVNEKNVLYGTTPEELAAATVRLIKDVNLRRKMANANRQLIESRFRWQRIADQYEELYKQMIQARGLRV